jgi:hypothetical protein
MEHSKKDMFIATILIGLNFHLEDEIMVLSPSAGVKTERSNTSILPYIFMCTFG